MNLLKLAAKLVLDHSGFKAGMKEVVELNKSSAAEMAKTFKSTLAGYFGYQAFNALVAKTVERVSNIKQLSEAFSVTTDEVQQLEKVARRAGKEFSDLGAMMDKGGAARKSAIEDSHEMRSKFLAWGVTLEDLQNPQLRNIDLLKKMAAAMDAGHITPQARQEFKEFFGKTAPQLLGVLAKWNQDEPITLIEKQQVDRIFEANRRLAELRKEWESNFIPAIARGAEELNKLLSAGKPGGKGLVGQSYETQFGMIEEVMAFIGRRVSGAKPNSPVDPLAALTGGAVNSSTVSRAKGMSEQEPGPDDKLGRAERTRYMQAEKQLADLTLETLAKQQGKLAEISLLKKQILDLTSEAQLIDESEVHDFRDLEDAANLRLKAKAKEAQLWSLQHAMSGPESVNELTKRGQLTGGAIARAGGRGLGRNEMPDPRPGVDLVKQNKRIIEILGDCKGYSAQMVDALARIARERNLF